MRPIESAWFSYQERVLLPAQAGTIQMQESRKVFYAGAAALWSAMFASLSPGPEPSLEDLRKMDGDPEGLRPASRGMQAWHWQDCEGGTVMQEILRDGTDRVTERATPADVRRAMGDPNVGKVVLAKPGESVRRWNGARWVRYIVDDEGCLR